MRKYLEARNESIRMREHNDCAVIAVSIAARVPYKRAHAALRDAGRRDRAGTYWYQSEKALRALGCTLEVIEPRKRDGGQYTMKTIGGAYKRGYYMIRVRGHVAAMVNGEVLDWSEGRRHRVNQIVRVTVPRGSRS